MQRKITFFFLLAFAMLSYQTTFAQTRGVTITGNCYLEGQTNHSGVKVLFTAVSPSAVTTEVFTTSTGSFIAGLPEGIYTVGYSKEEYLSNNLPGNASFFGNTTLADVTLLSNAFNYSGSQSGVWESDKPCRIVGDVTVNVDDTLIIQPGVEVKFMGNYKLDVYGTLLAAGMEGDSIVFTSGQALVAPNDWLWVKFSGSASSGSIITYAVVQYGSIGIYCESSAAPIISNCSTSHNGNSGISCQDSSSPTIQNNICNNNDAGISCAYSSSPTVHNNTCNNNYYGIYCYNSSPNIQNNICNNNNYGFFCYSSSPNIQNNTCNNNNTGIFCYDYSSPTIQNNICNNNSNGITCSSSSPAIQNNNVNNNINYGILCTYSPSTIQKNNIIQNGTGIYIESYTGAAPTILNNILVGNSNGISFYGFPETLSYNLFWENTTLYEGGGVPATFGEIITQNANADSCDTYFNLFMDPQFVFAGEYTFEACTNLVGDENPENDCKIKTVTNSSSGKVVNNSIKSIEIKPENENINILADDGTLKNSVLTNKTFSISNGKPGGSSSNITDDATIRYDDGENHDGIGLTSGGTFQVAAYFPGATMFQYAGMTLSKVEFYIRQVSISCKIKIYGQGSPTMPGELLHEETISPSEDSWTLLNLSNEVNITGEDIWIGYEISHPSGYHPAGCDNGPAIVGFGDMISLDGVSWDPISSFGLNYNWNIVGYLTVSKLNNVGVQSIVQPITGIGLSANEQVVIRIKNFGIMSQSNIPFSVTLNSEQLYNGTYPDSLESGEEVEILLPVTADLSEYSDYTFEACTNLPGDEHAGDNCKTANVTNIAPVHDICVQSILQPTSEAGLFANEPIVISIKNFGNVAESTFPYEVSWSGGSQSGSYTGIFEGTINPGEYVDITLPVTVDFTHDYHLQPTSPCIDAGNPAPAYYDPDGTVADMGAFYYDQGSAPPVISDFTATPVTGRMPLVVQFGQDIAGPVTEYLWVFGDGATSTLPNPVHVYNSMGFYSVSLMATGPGGSDNLVKTDYIHVLAPVPPLNAAFTASPLLGYAPLEVQFTNQSTGPYQNMLWDFGDGSTSTAVNPLHIYQQPGDYSVSLTLFLSGTEKTELKLNYIHAIAMQEVVAMFDVSGNNGAAPYTVAFFNQSFGSVDSLSWNFGDGGTSTLTNPLHTFVNPGEYQVTLTAYGPLNTSTASKTILAESVAPVITQITDRPNDQGGYVYVEFKKSFYDNVIPGKSTESYTIQREDDGHWVSLTSALAYGEAVYTIETATLADSVAGDNGLATYRVIAGMDEGTWISEPAQGYSTDNLAPEAPLVLNYELGDEQLAFSWNQSQANDFDYFAIYKSNVSGTFAGTPVSIQATTSYTETIAPDEAWFYSITAFDRAGNQSAYSEEVSTLRSMNLTVPQGWSGISGYLNIYDPAIENVFEPLSGNLIILQNETGVFWPGQNINTLGNWQSSEGYQIKLAQPSALTMKGTRLTDRSLQLAAGWNLIPVLAGQNTAIAGLFASTGLIMAKEVAGWRIYWPDYNISSLEVLEPGKAYFVLMASPATITFPAEATKSSLTNQSEMTGITPWNLPTRTPSTHVIAFETAALAAFEPGDIVGAFTKNGWCAGLAQFETNTLALVAFGDDELTASADGFASAEIMNFSLFRPSTGETFGLQLDWNPAMNSGNFAGHGISVVSGVKLSPTAINETAASGISIFPNPTHGIFTIQGISNPTSLKIFNAFGVEVSNPVIDLQGNVDLSAQPKGVYFLRIQSGEKVSFEKVVLN